MSRLHRVFLPQCTRERTLVLCWLSYTLAYLLRVNLAVVIPALIAERQYTYAQMGVVTGLFFMTYMFGQLLSGWLGDRYPGKLLIAGGLFVSALCNAGMILAPDIASLALVWAVNGLAQSLLWAPIMRTLSVWFTPRQLERVSFIMSMSMVVGYAASWGVSSVLAAIGLWPSAFWGPAVLAGLFLMILLPFFKSQPEPGDSAYLENREESGMASGQSSSDQPAAADQSNLAATPEKPGGRSVRKADPGLLTFIRMISLPGLMLIAMTQGIIREGISIWFPSIIESATSLTARSPWLVLAIVPLVNLGGILFVRRVNQHYKGDAMRTLLLIFTLAAGAALLLNLLGSGQAGAVLAVMMLLLSLTYGLTPILTSVIPFQYAQFKRVSLTAGVLDFAIYVGAAISAYLSGLIADRYSWTGVMLLWLAAAISGLIISVHRTIKQKGRIRHEQDIHHST